MEIIEISKSDSQKSWIKECITPYKGLCEFGGYRTLENLTLVIENIEKEIGSIIRLYKNAYADGFFIGLLIEHGNKKFLVSLGSNCVTEKQRARLKEGTPEQKLLEKIFGEKAKITDIQEYTYHQEYVCELNPEKEVVIDDVLQVMASISARSAQREVSLNPNGNAYYLASSNVITQCSIDTIAPIENDEYNLNVCFYKIEPLGNGKMSIKTLYEFMSDEELDDFLPDVD